MKKVIDILAIAKINDKVDDSSKNYHLKLPSGLLERQREGRLYRPKVITEVYFITEDTYRDKI